MIEKSGGELIVSDATRNTVPQIVRLEDGRLIVVFDTPIGQDARDVFGRFLDDDGPTGGVFKINTTDAGEQGLPSVAAIDGGFVVTWVDRGANGQDWQIRGQRYDLDGDKVGGEFAVTTAVGSQTTPTVTALDGGGFVVVWHDKIYERTFTQPDILKMQVFSASGAKLGGEVAVAAPPTGTFPWAFGQSEPHVLALRDGGFIVSWNELGSGGDTADTGVRSQIFNDDGTARGPRVFVNTATANGQSTPSATQLADGSLMIAYVELVSPFQPLVLKAQRVGLDGQKIGAEILLAHETQAAGAPEIVALANGGFVAVWEGGSGVGLFVREYTADGQPVGDTIRVNSPGGGTNLYSHVTATEDGFVVVWGTSGGVGQGDTVRAQYFTASGGEQPNPPTTGDDDLEGDDDVDDTISGLAGDDRIDGKSGDDVLNGDEGEDVLIGGEGDDELNGGTGADEMRGGAGDDDYVVDNAGDRVIEANGEGYDTVRSSVTFSLAGSFVEQLILTGFEDINATGNSLDNSLIGNGGDNVLDGGRGGDRMTGGLGDDTYIVAEAGDIVIEAKDAGHDTVRSAIDFDLAGRYVEDIVLTGTAARASGNSLANRLTGNASNNILDGRGGADTLIGGKGDDTYVVDNEGDRVIEKDKEGTDLVLSSVSYSLAGQYIEKLTLTGAAAVNATGNSLANTITGNAGVNVLAGGKGDDTYYVQTKGDRVIEKNKEGSDHVVSSVDFSLAGQYIEKLTLTGSAKYGTGNSLNNVITGNDGSNVLDGGKGHDVIQGGKGADALTGGAGGDRFVFASIEDSTVARSDRITDLEAGDKIDLRGIDANTTLAGDQAFTMVAAFTGAAAQMTMTYDAAAGITSLWLDVNGDGEADGLIRMNGDQRAFETIYG